MQTVRQGQAHAYHQGWVCAATFGPHTLSEWGYRSGVKQPPPGVYHAKPEATAALVPGLVIFFPGLVITTYAPLAPTSQTTGGWALQDNPQPPSRTTC
jgi:hypothetical protein